ncbi:heterokaryon incompatibility, partial [Immersiella caudata]
YIALSYTWGSSAAKKEIIVNGKPALITVNLHSALAHILSLKEGRLAGLIQYCEYLLWVDAVCINQQDASEKFVQVANMRHVFANAQWVVAWLGPAGDGSDQLLSDIHRWSPFLDREEEPPFNARALYSFFSRDWWTRMWILQE